LLSRLPRTLLLPIALFSLHDPPPPPTYTLSPTRRSSDLRRTAETLLAKEGCEVFTAVDGFDALAKIADHQPDIVFVDLGERIEADRKSTRLNSSHVAISYAVFCLKKKKKNNK